VGRAVPTFAQFENEVAAGRETGAFRNSWEMDYPLAQDFLQAL